jgi:D-beta-D-heptose 7-phosphate kinase/D-beta-D-heptose 1-phosphate adenosyltransferase
MQMARAAQVPVLVDPKGTDWEKYAGATLITPNLKELADAVGYEVANDDASVVKAARELANRHAVDAILVTRSEKGMSLVTEKEILHLPTRAREVFDVSGAGDTVIATMAVALGSGFPMYEAMKVANQAAGIVVGKAGTQPILQEELLCETKADNGSKVVSKQALLDRLKILRRKGTRVVFTNGCFDVLHAGHVSYLEQARRLGDILVVGLNSDESVSRLKGPGRPVNNEWARAKVLSSLSCVDYVVVFGEDTPYELIRDIVPDCLVKGSDYREEDVVGREFAGQVVLIDFVNGYSTTRILDKLSGPHSSK